MEHLQNQVHKRHVPNEDDEQDHGPVDDGAYSCKTSQLSHTEGHTRGAAEFVHSMFGRIMVPNGRWYQQHHPGDGCLKIKQEKHAPEGLKIMHTTSGWFQGSMYVNMPICHTWSVWAIYSIQTPPKMSGAGRNHFIMKTAAKGGIASSSDHFPS